MPYGDNFVAVVVGARITSSIPSSNTSTFLHFLSPSSPLLCRRTASVSNVSGWLAGWGLPLPELQANQLSQLPASHGTRRARRSIGSAPPAPNYQHKPDRLNGGSRLLTRCDIVDPSHVISRIPVSQTLFRVPLLLRKNI